MRNEQESKIARELVGLARELVAEDKTQPDLYILKEDGTVIPIVLSSDNNVTTAAKHIKHHKKSRSKSNPHASLPQPTGKDIYLTPQAYEFYSKMDEKNKNDFRTYYIELQTRGTLEGNPHAEKVDTENGVFAIRLTLRQSNDSFFYAYLDGSDVIVFDAYTRAKQKIPKQTLNQAKKDAKRFKQLTTLDGLKPFNEVLQESQDNSANNTQQQQ